MICRPGKQLVDRPGVDDRLDRTPHAAARSHPYGCQSSWPGACASVSIDTRQPASTASRSNRFGGSSRSGRRVHLDGHSELRAGGEHDLGVELRLGPLATPARDQPAGAVPEHVGVRVGDRRRPCAESSPWTASAVPLWTLATTRSRRPSRIGVWSSVPSSRMSTSMPVRMRNGAISCVQRGDNVELLLEPLGRQPARDREPRRVIGEHDVLVAEVAGRLRPSPRWAIPRRTSPSAVWQSPRRAARSAAPASATGRSDVASRRRRYTGTSPCSDSVMHRAVTSPMPDSFAQRAG